MAKMQSRILNSQEIYDIVMELRKPYNIITLFQLYTGLSVSDILSLETEVVYDENGDPFHTITIKNHRRQTQRVIDVPDPLWQILKKEHKPGEKWVFTAVRTKRPIEADLYRHEIKRACRILGIENVTPHCFRRTALLRLYESGRTLRELKAISGHVRTDHLLQCIGLKEKSP